MAKKRSCRRTVNEDKVHEKAVKIRKMTDEQLVQYVNDIVEKARSEGFNQGKKSQKSKVSEIPQSAKSWSISERKGLRMKKTPLQIFEERNEKDCCLNCKKLIVKQTDAGHINFCGETGKIILDMFLDIGTHFPKCKYERKE